MAPEGGKKLDPTIGLACSSPLTPEGVKKLDSLGSPRPNGDRWKLDQLPQGARAPTVVFFPFRGRGQGEGEVSTKPVQLIQCSSFPLDW
jgi:hypothetical protein